MHWNFGWYFLIPSNSQFPQALVISPLTLLVRETFLALKVYSCNSFYWINLHVIEFIVYFRKRRNIEKLWESNQVSFDWEVMMHWVFLTYQPKYCKGFSNLLWNYKTVLYRINNNMATIHSNKNIRIAFVLGCIKNYVHDFVFEGIERHIWICTST